MAFFALGLPAAGQSTLDLALKDWRLSFPEVNWMHPEDYHITLCFLGGLDPVTSHKLQASFAADAPGVPSFSLALSGFQSFASGRSEVILWIGIKDQDPALSALHEQLKARALAAGYPVDQRTYRAHLTLGRVPRALAGLVLNAWAAAPLFTAGPFNFRSYQLMERRKSKPIEAARDSEPLYKILADYPLLP